MHTFAYMAFYKSISDHYDAIFPLNPMQPDFVLKSFDKASGLKVLDVGCGTGSLCLALAPHFREVIGIDPDEMMLKLAIAKAGGDQPGLSFHPYGMLDLEKHDIFNEKIDGLPTIENDSIKFVRNYHYTDRSALDFETILSIKESGEEIRNTISLFPILKDELIRLVQKAGFHDILVYGNFKRDPYLPGSIPLLLQATS